MRTRPRAFVLASTLLIVLSSTSFQALTSTPTRTLTFAELTYGVSIGTMVAAQGGGAWFGGTTCVTTLPTTANAVQRTKTAGCHGVLGKVMPDGSIAYLSYL